MNTRIEDAATIVGDLSHLRKALKDRSRAVASLEADMILLDKAEALESYMNDIIRKNGVNVGVATLFYNSLESLEVEFDKTGLESVSTPEEAIQPGMEGIRHLIDRIKDRFKNWRDRGMLNQEGFEGRSGDTVTRLSKAIDELTTELKRMPAGVEVEIKFDSLKEYLVAGEREWAADPLGWVRSSMTVLDKAYGEFYKRASALESATGAALNGLDMTSEAAFKRTWLSRVKGNQAHFWTNPPEALEAFPEFGIKFLGLKNTQAWNSYVNGDYSSKEVVQAWMCDPVAVRYKPPSGGKSGKVSPAGVIALLTAAQTLITKINAPAERNRRNQLTNIAHRLHMRLYDIEVQRRLSSQKHVASLDASLRVGSLQFGAGPLMTYAGDGVYTCVYGLLASAHVSVQIARRTLTAVKAAVDN